MSLPYRPQLYNHNAIGIITLKEPVILLDVYSVMFQDKLLNQVPVQTESGKLTSYVKERLELTVELEQSVEANHGDYVREHMYINGCQLGRQPKAPHFVMDVDKSLHDNYIVTIKFDDMDINRMFNITLKFNNAISGVAEEFMLHHVPGTNKTNYCAKHGINISNTRSSYMLLRTNPALAGNIKLVCTSDDKIYLDTFKEYTENILSHRSYRKQPVGKEGNYPLDVFNTFSSLDPEILMQLKKEYRQKYNSTVYTDIKYQYMSDYEYGASENYDNLYSETMKILAPLYIGERVPDYFIIFRADIDKLPNPTDPDGLTATDAYDGPVDAEIDFTDTISSRYKSYIDTEEVFKHASTVKIFDLRNSTNIGSYLNGYQTIAEPYINKSLFINFHTFYNRVNSFRPNTAARIENRYEISGIAYKAGEMVHYKQSTNFWWTNQNICDDDLTNLYRSNSLLHPNILNLEFMFNDETAEEFKSYNYFGLYVTENQLKSISHVINVHNDSKNITEAFDTEGQQFNLYQEMETLLTALKSGTRLFSVSTNDSVAVVKNNDEVLKFVKTNVVNKPGSMIGQAAYKQISHIPMSSFITLKFDDKISVGEHFKIIYPVDSSDISDHCQVLEFIASNDERLTRYKKQHGHYINTTGIYDTEFYQIPFYVSEKDTLPEQIHRLASCIKLMDSFVYVSCVSDDSITISSQKDTLMFQHILSPGYEGAYDYVHYYNCEHQTPVVDNNDNTYFDPENYPVWYSYNNPLYSTLTERLSSVVPFVRTSALTGYYVYEIDGEYDTYLNGAVQPLYYSDSRTYEPLGKINLMSNQSLKEFGITDDSGNVSDFSVYCILSPLTPDKHYIFTKKPISKTSYVCNLYNSKGFNISVLGITPVKDICTMYDTGVRKEYSSFDTVVIPEMNSQSSSIYAGSYGIKLFHVYQITDGQLTPAGCGAGSTLMFISPVELIYENTNNGQIYKWLVSKFSPLRALKKTILFDKTNYGTGHHEYTSERAWPTSAVLLGCSYNMAPNTLSGWQSTNVPFIGQLKITPDHLKPVDKAFGYLSYPSLSRVEMDTCQQFVPYSLFDYITESVTKAQTLRDLILTGTPNILNYFYRQYIKVSSVTYKANIIEFTYNGITYQFHLSSIDNAYDITQHISDLKNYEAMVVIDFKPKMRNELFISTEEKIILFAIHNLYMDLQSERINNVITITQPGDNNKKRRSRGIRMANYYWVDSDYKYDYINTTYAGGLPAFRKMDIQGSDNTPWHELGYVYTQTGYPIYHHVADFQEPGYNIVMDLNNGGVTDHPEYIHPRGNFDIYDHNTYLLTNDMTVAQKTQTGVDGDNKPIYDTVIPEQRIHSECTTLPGLYKFFRDAGKYNERTHEGYVNVIDDGIAAYDIVNKQDNRVYESFWIVAHSDRVDREKIKD